MSYHECTVEDITFRVVPFRPTPHNGELTLHICCTCRHCATVGSNKECRKLGTISHDVAPEADHTALPFRLEPLDEQANFVELPTRATSLRQGIREFYEAHQRRTATHEAAAQLHEYRERQHSDRMATAEAELDQLTKTDA